ncbi:hypothetical protein OLMES_3208 [Oleiphilus messinensis]|uniref:Uncharacterized protein n=1 Tax=Oleiphilus messinensis TaxID=141451 RepID=A0A1Y0IAR0_9GAMM|nr:hypothetical protein [Oleiphilus messinensis]ARU57249.1 hypothetical protein OLMES_3208 [Oleiphilus messinensis]
MDKTVCDRCGLEVFGRSLRIENLGKIDQSSKEACVQSLMKLEGVSQEVATSWAEHGIHEQCKKCIRNCPNCGKELKSWQAKMCLHCGTSFKPWSICEKTT